MQAYSVHDRRGYLALTVIVRSKSDAMRAAEIGCDPTLAPYRLAALPMSAARAALDYWRNNATVDLTNNEGWDEL